MTPNIELGTKVDVDVEPNAGAGCDEVEAECVVAETGG